MSLKSTFLALKKVVQVVQIGERGGGNLDKIQKDGYFFSGDLPLDILWIDITGRKILPVESKNR